MIEIFSKENCAQCEKEKMLCQMKSLAYEEKDIYQALDDIAERSGQVPRTAPQIFVDGRYVGGYDEFAAYLKNQ